MHRGGSLISPTIAYETWGTLNHQRDNAVLIFTGMSPSAHAASSTTDPTPGWWEEIIGPGRSIDTHRYFVVCVNSLGSCFGSAGPDDMLTKPSESPGNRISNASAVMPPIDGPTVALSRFTPRCLMTS